MDESSSTPPKTTSLDFAVSSAKILFLVVGIASTLFLISTHIQRFILSFASPTTWSYPEFSRFSSTYLFIVVHFIILIIWKLNPNHLQDSTQDPSDLYSSPSISRKSSIEHVLASQRSSESVLEARTASQEVPEPVLDIHTVESTDEKDIPTPADDAEAEAEAQEDYSDSLDATWQAIVRKQLEKGDSWEKFNQQVHAKLKLTRDVPVPLVESREFKKSDTFKESKNFDEGEDSVKKEMRKSKTFKENSSSIRWRGRDVLVEKDEMLRNKIEAFIKMNYDQRMKKQGSNDNCLIEMVNTAY